MCLNISDLVFRSVASATAVATQKPVTGFSAATSFTEEILNYSVYCLD